MMIKLSVLLTIVSVLVLFDSEASASIITDTEAVNSRVGYLFEGAASQVNWTHDLSDHSFMPGTAMSATLSIEISDDYDRWWNIVPEYTSIVVGVLDFQDDDMIYRAASDWEGSLGLNSLVSLNASGLLDVTLQSIVGDFLVGTSTLNVITSPLGGKMASASDLDTMSTPEPATLLLMSIGLAGFGVPRIKNMKKSLLSHKLS
jgi:hypothetical protein